MASDREFVKFVCEQMADAGETKNQEKAASQAKVTNQLPAGAAASLSARSTASGNFSAALMP